MLRRGDLVRWDSVVPNDGPSFGIVLEDQDPIERRILVYWVDDGEASHEQIEWMTPLRK